VKKSERRAIIDIGSNSIRLVVFGGAPRAPIVLYNEKFSAGLGRGVIDTGALDTDASEAGLAALSRFALLVKNMDVKSLQVVATAAVRDARNGKSFLKRVKALGLPVRLLSGDEEAITSGYGVIAAQPHADGIAVDLGGGSMELVRISGGKVHDYISLPLGILRVAEITAQGPGALRAYLQTEISGTPWFWNANDLPLYLVGGTWRALARVHIHLKQAALPVIGNYRMEPADAAMLERALADMDIDSIKAIPSMPGSRAPVLHDGAQLLAALNDIISPSHMIVCAFGLREGLLYQNLSPAERGQDPLIAGAQYAAAKASRFAGYGEALANWLNALFPGERPEMLRLRHAACLLADLAWSSNPEFRATSAEELALHGNWVGVNADDRLVLAIALYTSFGGDGDDLEKLKAQLPDEMVRRARIWGLTIRLANRLSAGTAAILNQCAIRIDGGDLVLRIPNDLKDINNNSVRRRFSNLTREMNIESRIKII
jgi:exopolyphosphatase / guanosine-5'-triphosphate,3'-diphosphate pyrophosphatase